MGIPVREAIEQHVVRRQWAAAEAAVDRVLAKQPREIWAIEYKAGLLGSRVERGDDRAWTEVKVLSRRLFEMLPSFSGGQGTGFFDYTRADACIAAGQRWLLLAAVEDALAASPGKKALSLARSRIEHALDSRVAQFEPERVLEPVLEMKARVLLADGRREAARAILKKLKTPAAKQLLAATGTAPKPKAASAPGAKTAAGALARLGAWLEERALGEVRFGKPIAAAEVSRASARLGEALPASYVAFVRMHGTFTITVDPAVRIELFTPAKMATETARLRRLVARSRDAASKAILADALLYLGAPPGERYHSFVPSSRRKDGELAVWRYDYRDPALSGAWDSRFVGFERDLVEVCAEVRRRVARAARRR